MKEYAEVNSLVGTIMLTCKCGHSGGVLRWSIDEPLQCKVCGAVYLADALDLEYMEDETERRKMVKEKTKGA
jgi:hypothetical protein